MRYESKRYIGAQEIIAGAHFSHPGGLRGLTPQIVVVCDAVAPDRWHGEVTVHGRTVLQTEQYDAYEQAARAAEQQFIDRLVRLISG